MKATAGACRTVLVIVGLLFIGGAAAAEVETPADISLAWVLPETEGRVVHSTGPSLVGPVGRLEFHDFMLITALIGTPVLCPLAGTVVATGLDPDTGGTAVVRHRPGVFTTYEGLQELWVSSGDSVEVGDVLGRLGSGLNIDTGGLRFQLWVDSGLVDPVPCLLAGMPDSVGTQAASDLAVIRNRVEDATSP